MKANAASMRGTPKMKTGMKRGAKKKKVTPLVGGVRPPITMVEALMSRPNINAPASPMNNRAGWKLSGRNPKQMPQVAAAMSGPGLVAGKRPRAS